MNHLLWFLAAFVIGFGLLAWIRPVRNLLMEGLQFPFWSRKLRGLARNEAKPKRIKYGEHRRQYMLYHQPNAKASEKKHVIVYVHGSAWKFGRPELFQSNAEWLADQGYHSFFLSHRRIPHCDIREIREDARLGIGAVLAELKQLGLADRQLIACGNSAGGNLMALAFFDRNLLRDVVLSQPPFAALAVFAAPLDLSVMWPSPPLLLLTRGKQATLMQLANPACYLTLATDVPILIVHGKHDGTVEHENALAFYHQLESLGSKNVQFHLLDGNHLDAASWCFPNHPSSDIFRKWLESVKRQSLEK